MKAALRSMWRENETRMVRYPLVFAVVFIVLSSVLGLLQDGNADAIPGFLTGPR